MDRDRILGTTLETNNDPSPNYELSTQDERLLCEQLIEQNPDIAGQMFACFVFQEDSTFANLGRSKEAAIFNDTFANDVNTMKQEYGPYEPSSIFFVTIDPINKKVVGVLRAIENSDTGLKTLNDIEQPPLKISPQEFMEFHSVDDLNKCWDIGTVAVDKEYRGKTTGYIASALLYRSLFLEANNKGIEHFIAIVDKSAFKSLKMVGMPFVPILNSEPYSYLGSEESTAVYGLVASGPVEMQKLIDKLDQEFLENGDVKKQQLSALIDEIIHGSNIDQFIVK
jgi:hypothetical protein